MNTLTGHAVMWASPSPLWGRFGAPLSPDAFAAPDQARPAILRFASDEFMNQIIAMLETDPRRMGEVIARPETWRNPSGETPDLIEPTPLPRLARRFARLRKGAAKSSTLGATTDLSDELVNGVRRTLPLKLYHPAHQRYYLVAANLVCGIPGFPDHRLATGGREQVGFVLRRLLTPKNDPDSTELEEFAFVKDGHGARWQRVVPLTDTRDPFARPVDGEEMLPLFPMSFRDEVGQPRRALAGLIPVGRREEYMSCVRKDDPPVASVGGNGNGNGNGSLATNGLTSGETVLTKRKEQFKLDVSEPWKALLRAAYAARKSMNTQYGDPPSLLKQQKTARQFNEQAQHQSWLILLDFADYLAHHLPSVWDVVRGVADRSSLTSKQADLMDWLDGTAPQLSNADDNWHLTGPGFLASMREALKTVSAERDRLEEAENIYPHVPEDGPQWPSFLYLLAGIYQEPDEDFSVRGKHESLVELQELEDEFDHAEATLPEPPPAETQAAVLDQLVQLVVGAIDRNKPAAAAPLVPFAAQVRDGIRSTIDEEGWFRLRCVYVRCDCGPLWPAVFSAPSQRFQLASFFDPDAPARPIQIALPFDTSAAGMRKHQKNTAFVISDVLCGQINRLKGLGFVDLVLSVLPWPFHKDLDIGSDGIGPCRSDVNMGMICSLSIPIITICALILLFMIVLVLDAIFHWIPWFIVCFPLRLFKAKK